MKRNPSKAPATRVSAACLHGAPRELRARVWWCSDCGAAQLATGATPKPGEWIRPHAGIVLQVKREGVLPTEHPVRIGELEHRISELEIFFRRLSHALRP